MLILADAAEPSLIDINFGLMFWTIVTFVIVLLVLKKYAFGDVLSSTDIPNVGCVKQPPFEPIGQGGPATDYLHVFEQP